MLFPKKLLGMGAFLPNNSHKYNLTNFPGKTYTKTSRIESEILQQKATENPWTNKASVSLPVN